MDKRQELINRIKQLLKTHDAKTKQYQEQHGLSADFGCITRESCVITSLLPEMQRLGVTLDDCKEDNI